jgi:hypothetical protein
MTLIADEGLRPVLPKDSGGMKNLLGRCWDPEPLLRPDFTSILESLEDALRRVALRR